ncbi:MAG: ribbon-helix-helix protein, CopG family [Candidatus Binatia bacterium]
MPHPTTIRLSDDLLRKIDRRARARGVDRATYLRNLVSDAVVREDEEQVVTAYREGKLTLSEGARRLGVDVWGFFDLLRRRGETLSVTLEDWMDSEHDG